MEGTSPRPKAFGPGLLTLTGWEWAAVGLVIASVVGINKLIIHDRGGTWGQVIYLSVGWGLALVMLNRWRVEERRRRRARRQV